MKSLILIPAVILLGACSTLSPAQRDAIIQSAAQTAAAYAAASAAQEGGSK